MWEVDCLHCYQSLEVKFLLCHHSLMYWNLLFCHCLCKRHTNSVIIIIFLEFHLLCHQCLYLPLVTLCVHRIQILCAQAYHNHAVENFAVVDAGILDNSIKEVGICKGLLLMIQLKLLEGYQSFLFKSDLRYSKSM